MSSLHRVFGARHNRTRLGRSCARHRHVGLSLTAISSRSCHWLETAQDSPQGRRSYTTSLKTFTFRRSVPTQKHDAREIFLPFTVTNDTQKDSKDFHAPDQDYNERFFASSTRLPRDFFNDVHQIRSLALQNDTSRPEAEDEERMTRTHSNAHYSDSSLDHNEKSSRSPKEIASGNLDTFEEHNNFFPFTYDDLVNSRSGSEEDENRANEESSTITEENGSMSQSDSRGKSMLEFQSDALFRRRWHSSYWIRRGKAALSGQDAIKLETRKHEVDEETPWPVIRGYLANSVGLRQALKFFMETLSASTIYSISDEDQELDIALIKLIRTQSWKRVQSAGYGIDDVQAWSWILLAPPDKAVRRWDIYSRWLEQNDVRPMPSFIFLQLLRSKEIDAFSLRIAIDRLKSSTSSDNLDDSSTLILIVRLLRHARMVAPELFGSVIGLTFQLLPPRLEWSASSKKMIILTHWFNRVLSLLALPTRFPPIKSVPFQQEAQLEVVRHMYNFKPPISINREGYRAMLGVQKMHGKTETEKEWARVKAPSWPPWQSKDQMGHHRDQDFPGKQSRVVKVLQRMQEGGYQLSDQDMAARVLAGWDTDESPTIQTRRQSVLHSEGRSWLLGQPFDAENPSSRIWAARVDATRSVREAWMCFCSYTETVSASQHSVDVYTTMFSKLLARVVKDESATLHLPGDGLVTYLDPVLARDRVYIPEPVPTVAALYTRMRDAGLKPGRRLLSLLLDHAESIEQGLQYIKDSSLRSSTKDILLGFRPESRSAMADELEGLPLYLVGSYVYLLARQEKIIQQGWRKFYPMLEFGQSKKEYSQYGLMPLNFAIEVLVLVDSPSSHLWNQYLRGLLTHLRRPKNQTTSSVGLTGLWRLARTALRYMDQAGVVCDLEIFRSVSHIALQLQTWDGSMADRYQNEPLETVQELFMQGIYGSKVTATKWLPLEATIEGFILENRLQPSDVEIMIWHLGVAQSDQTIEQILTLLQWMNAHQALLHDVSSKHVAVVRVILEGCWADEECWKHGDLQVATTQQLDRARLFCEPFGWAQEEEVDEYLEHNDSKIQRLRRVMMAKTSQRSNVNQQYWWATNLVGS